MTTKMTTDERQAFLAEARVAIISIPEEGRGPLAVPVWYNYQPGGDALIWTGAGTRKGQLLQKSQRISLCVQDPTPPNYKYVTIEGPFTIQPVDLERDIHPMALRYLGPSQGAQYFDDVRNSEGWKNDILVRITPERWYTVDYGKESQVSAEAKE
jgi:nitroimidazol reductase NimA-like FMN-containing flavoprotein (pyridoxamine 5'-phosphate oxidase superfamily)